MEKLILDNVCRYSILLPPIMKRTTIWLSEEQIARLKKLSERKGLAIAELIRRFVDEGLEKGASNADRKKSR